MKTFFKLYFISFVLYTSSLFAQTGEYKAGISALASRTTGNYNIAVGDYSLYSLTTGSHNTALGFRAGFGGTRIDRSVFVGYETGYSLGFNFETDLTFIGFRAGYYFQGVSDGTFIGSAAGFNNTSGVDNTFVGEKAGLRVTTGDDNTYIGNDAGASQLSTINENSVSTTHPATGSDNTAIGSAAGYELTSGYRNAMVGANAGSDLTTGYRNTFVGDSTGIDVGIGHHNTFIGQAAGAATEYTSFNTFIGALAGGDNNRTNKTTNENASYNTYLGYSAGYTNREGKENVVIGAEADFDHVGDNNGVNNLGNVIIGRSAHIGVRKNYTTTLGYRSYSDGDEVISLGNDANVQGNRSIGIGGNVQINSIDAISIGYQATTSNNAEFAIGLGRESNITGDKAIAIGYQAEAGNLGIAMGNGSSATANYSLALGHGVSVATANTMALGGDTALNRTSVGIGTLAANQNASLELADTDKGFLLNRLTTALRTTLGSSLSAVEKGLIVYDTEDDAIYTWSGSDWISATNTDAQAVDLFQLNGNNLELSLENDAASPLTVDLTSYMDNTDKQTADVFQLNGNNLELSLENDGVATETVDLSSFIDNTDAQDLSLSVTTLSLTNDASDVDLSAFMDNTDNQNISGSGLTGTNLTIGIEGGTSQTIDLSSLQDGTGTDDQTIVLSGDALSIEDGNSIDLSGYLDNTDDQNISGSGLSGTTLTIGVEGGTSEEVDLSSLQDGTGTDDQILTLSGDALSIEDANSVDLSGYLDNTDNQNISGSTLSGTNLTIGIEGGTPETLDLSSLQDGIGTDDQNLTLSGDALSIEDGNSVNLSGYLDNTDSQTLTISGADLSISNGNIIDLSFLQDGSGTDDQTLSLNSNTLSIEAGNSVDLSNYLDNTDNQSISDFTLNGTILNLRIENGNTVQVDIASVLQPLEDENASQQAQIDDLIARVETIEACACDGTLGVPINPIQEDHPYIEQNIPNPFNGGSSIQYYLPPFSKNAAIVFSNTSGQILSNITLNKRGESELYINSNSIASGVYYYTLYVDGKRIDTKKMVVK